LSKPMEI